MNTDLEDSLKTVVSQNEELKRAVDALEAQKNDMKLDHDNNLYNIQKKYQQERSTIEDHKIRSLEQIINKLQKERDDLNSRLKNESKVMLDKFKSLSDLISSADSKNHEFHDRLQTLEKENLSLKSKLA